MFRLFDKRLIQRALLIGLPVVIVAMLFLWPLKKTLFSDRFSTVLFDRDGRLLGAAIADDGQWRFSPADTVPVKLEQAIITFEDKRFYHHFGIDLFSVGRAFVSNIRQHRIVSGASTITMQIARLARKRNGKSFIDKLIEAVMAVKIECSYSKKEILKMYITYAPYGGNIVGAQAASWRYFYRDLDNLSWAEAALLAVLPNSPARFYPGSNNPHLKEVRDRLLAKLYQNGTLSKSDYEISVDEPLPDMIYPIPQAAPHLLTRIINDGHRGESVKSTIRSDLQNTTREILKNHQAFFSLSNIYNGCAIVVDIATGDVLAYVGNTDPVNGLSKSNSVDIIKAQRSPGSLLKPFLYAFAMNDGEIYPDQLLPDIPLVYEGFAPKNFSKTYDGAVPASDALTRSLNIPFVFLLSHYSYQKFYDRLGQVGLHFDYNASHYALSMVLGGVEVSMWDVTSAYASLARVLNRYNRGFGEMRYCSDDYHENRYVLADHKRTASFTANGTVNAAAIYCAFDAMKDLVRPYEDAHWERFASASKISWKTGTSYGNRDAWAIGLNSRYLVGVWVGNADGEGRPEIKGVSLAAPVMLDIFGTLPHADWFVKPVHDMIRVPICKKSGMLASQSCDEVEEREIPASLKYAPQCPYDRIVHLDETGSYRVDSATYPVYKMQHKNYFVLPPVEEWYYRRINSSYVPLPPAQNKQTADMAFIYPGNNAKIKIPIELDGSAGRAVFEIAHRKPDTTIYWHLDGEYLGMTKNIHQIDVHPAEGKHTIVAIDEYGTELIEEFTVVR